MSPRSSLRKLRALLMVGVLSGAATCVGFDGPIFGEPEARVKLMNAASFDFAAMKSGAIAPGDENITFGGTSRCYTVNPSSHGMGMRRGTFSYTWPSPIQSGSASVIYVVLGNESMFQFIDAQGGNHATAGMSAVMVINAVVGGAYDIHLTAPGAALGTPTIANVKQGVGQVFTQVTPGSFQMTATVPGTHNPVATLGTRAFGIGGTTTIVIGPAATAGGPLRSLVLLPSDFC